MKGDVKMLTKAQILKAKIITKISYYQDLKEEIDIMVKKHKNLLNKEVDNKYASIIKREEKKRNAAK
jgi:hypothetical protein